MDITFNDYQTRVATFRKPTADFTYAVIGLGAEVGEIQGKVAKIIRDKNGLPDDSDHYALIKELGDVLWFISAIADDMGVSLNEVAQENVAKLESRSIRGKIGGSGDDR